MRSALADGVGLLHALPEPGRARVVIPSNRSPEADACRDAFRDVVGRCAALAAVTGNLERLGPEYRRIVGRPRALQDVLVPEIDRSVYDIETRLEVRGQEDAMRMRQGAG